MNRSLASLALLVSTVVALPSLALAEGSVSLAYEAPEGCPAQPEFVAAVAARGGAFEGEGAAGARRVMVVAIRRDSRGFAGAFQVRDGDAATNKREVRGESCGEVVDALAVVTAIALRSDAAADVAPVVVTPVPALPVAAPSPDEAPATQAAPPRLRGHTQQWPPRAQEVVVGAGTLRFDRQQSYTVSGGVVVGVVPSQVIPRYDLAVTTANFVTTPEGTQRIDGSIVRIRVSILGEGTYRTASTTTTFLGASFGVGVCGSPYYDTGGLVLLICGEYGGGFMNLVTKGSDGSQLQSKNAGFGEILLDGVIQYNFGASFLIQAKVGGGSLVGNLTAERADGSAIFGDASSMWHWTAHGLLGMGLHY